MITLYNKILFTGLLSILLIDAFAQDNRSGVNNAYINNNSGFITCSNGAVIGINHLLQNRGVGPINISNSPSIPSVCTEGVKNQMDAMIERFKQEDQNNIQGLANNFCSHQTGWVEKVLGTCGAGGPPPICLADHWIQKGRAESLKDYEKQAQIKAKERAIQISKLGDNVCSCAVSELKKQDRIYSESLSKPLSSDFWRDGVINKENKASIRITCMGGCPPGYTCKEGYCEEDGAMIEKRVLNKVVDRVKDKATDEIKDKAMKLAGAEALKETLKKWATVNGKYLAGFSFVAKYSTFFSNAVLGVIDPDGGLPKSITGRMSGGNELYTASLAKVSESINQLTDLYNEIIRLNTGQNQVRDRKYITDDIAKERSALAYQLQLLDGYRREVTWTCKGCCDQMQDYQHQSAVDYANKILNVNIE